MTILEYIETLPNSDLYDLLCQLKDNWCPNDQKFCLCIDELPWFRDHGIKNRTGGENGCRDDGRCLLCDLEFIQEELVK